MLFLKSVGSDSVVSLNTKIGRHNFFFVLSDSHCRITQTWCHKVMLCLAPAS